jgi:hypothetical protein
MNDQKVHPDARRSGGWSWVDPVRGEHFRQCSYCGGINPEDLVAEPEWRANWADPTYGWPHKFYVDVLNRAPERLYVVSAAHTDGPPPPLFGEDYVAWNDRTAEQKEICDRDGYGEDRDGGHPSYVAFGLRPLHHARFYTVHLADADLAAETKAAIEQVSGLAFQFADGIVSWKGARREPSRP